MASLEDLLGHSTDDLEKMSIEQKMEVFKDIFNLEPPLPPPGEDDKDDEDKDDPATPRIPKAKAAKIKRISASDKMKAELLELDKMLLERGITTKPKQL